MQEIVGLDPEDEDFDARPKFEDIELCIGWKIVEQRMVEQNVPGQKRTRKEVTIDWGERTVEESFNDVKTFASDLAEAIEGRLEANTNVSY